MIQLGDFRLDLINDGLFELKPDNFVRVGAAETPPMSHVRRRVRVAFNSLLIRGRGRTIVIDPGTGDKPHSQQVRDYHMEWPRKFFPALTELGVRPEGVDTVILTHLHWDHCGGATSLDAGGKPVPVFWNAKYFVQRRELDAARAAIKAGDDSFLADDFEPLITAHRLQFLEGDAEVLPGISVEWTGGHSPGHQIVRIDGGHGKRAIYLSDLVPTIAQIPFDSVMSYDVNVDELLSAKERVLMAAAAREDLLFFVHAPRQRAAHLQRRPDGEFQLEHVQL
jgi:glyoxylase-like metal-dependent hydrolase (beta-lactamase superfamily II)